MPVESLSHHMHTACWKFGARSRKATWVEPTGAWDPAKSREWSIDTSAGGRSKEQKREQKEHKEKEGTISVIDLVV